MRSELRKPLVIVESPAKARTIESFLGRDRFTVKASRGHIRDLPRNAKEVPAAVTDPEVRRLAIDVHNHFEPIWVVPDAKREVVAELKRALADASELYLATDEDREGEAISWHVLEILRPDVPVRRMVFHEITRHAIEDAIEHPREVDTKLVEAQTGRRVLDRLFGYEMSVVMRRRAGGATSAGRVQSVAARLVVDRERARMAFRTASYWDLDGRFAVQRAGDAEPAELPARLVALDGRRLATGKDFDPATGALGDPDQVACLDEEGAVALVARLRDRPFTVTSVEERSQVERPKPPFTTSTLQQEAARKLGFSAARTMSIAQKLYEHGYITYMRTDSTNLSDEAVAALREQIGQLYGADHLPDEPRSYRSKVKNAQEAHEAVRPAGDSIRMPDAVAAELHTTDERRLYELVWKRTVACQMADARVRRVTVRLGATSTADEEAVFQATGRTIEFAGYLRAYVEGADDPDAELEDREALLPPLAEGNPLECLELVPSAHTTQPPARYTEASLVKELEERGIGRPSTYAVVLDTLLSRGYTWKRGTALVPTWTAFAKVQLLERHFAQLIDYEFTAIMEEALDVIARGEGEAEKWLHAFYFGNGQVGLRELVDESHLATIDAAKVNAVQIATDEQGREVVVRVWPDGANVERDDEKAPVPVDLAPDELTMEKVEELFAVSAAGPRVVGEDSESGLPVLVLTGRFGPFVQLGELDEGSKQKPKRASLLSGMAPDAITLEQAVALLSLPRTVGTSDGVEVTAHNGRYGPYLRRGDDSRSLESEEQLFTVGLEEAEALFAQPKRRGRRTKPPIAELGAHPDSGAAVRVLDGRFGPYVTDGALNASVPRGVDPALVTLDEAVELLREREARGPAKTPKRPPRTTSRTVSARTDGGRSRKRKAT